VAFGINSFLKARPQQAETVPVVIAIQDVTRFASLSEDMLKVRQYPKDLVPPGSIRTIDDAVNRVTFASLVKGEALSDSKLSVKGAGRGMGPAIPKGMRAFTINTPNVAANVAGFILPGSKVDILMTVKNHGHDDPSGGASTIPLLQNVEVLAVDQRVEAPSSSKVDIKELRSITLLVTPDQSAKLDLGQNAGTLHLSLRNPDDTAETKTKPATLAELRQLEQPRKEKEQPKVKETVKEAPPAPPPAPPAPPPPALVRTIRGVDNNIVIIRN
jgi:pilus assembly protein CpaB